jgi:hypothetical protein
MWSYLRRKASRPGTFFPFVLAPLLVAADCYTGSTASTTLGTVVVTVLRSDGTAFGGAVITVLGENIGAVTNASGIATLVARAGDHRVYVRYIGCPPATTDVTIPAGGSVGATVTVGCGMVDAVNDVAAPTAPRIWLLDHGSNASGTCENDLLVESVGLTSLGWNASPEAAATTCHLAALVLAKDRAPFFTNAAADFNWTAALGDVYAPMIPAGKLQLPVRIIISDPALSTINRDKLKLAIETAELALVQLALDNSYAGITLVDPAGGPPQVTVDNAALPVLTQGCLGAAAIRANPAIYAAGRLNVYYVPEVRSEEGSPVAGYACATSEAPNIVFVDHDGHFTSLLAHELGHALGNITPFWGHADYFEGFYEESDGRKLNVMVDGLSDPGETLPGDARYYSVGQVSRMHLGDASWLNKSSATDGSTLRARLSMPGAGTIVPCGCPETAATTDCARVNRDIDRSTATVSPRGPWTGYIMACNVVATTPTVEICAGATAAQEAKFFQSGVAAKGSSIWVSLNPNVVSAASTSAPFGSNIMNGALKGLVPGNATVLAYADGAFATVAVTVKPPPC